MRNKPPNIENTILTPNICADRMEISKASAQKLKAGRLAIGLENADFQHIMHNKIDHDTYLTLLHNQSDCQANWLNIRNIYIGPFNNKDDLMGEGYPCRTLWYAGQWCGFNETRGR